MRGNRVRWQAGRFATVCLIGLLVSLILAAGLLIAWQRASSQAGATFYAALPGQAEWQGDWEFSAQGADPSEAGSLAGRDRVIIHFSGTDLALRVRRGDYRGYLYVSVDGAPANRLPRDERGAYLVLTSPDLEPQVVSIPVARELADGPHVAEVVAERGWDQWPLVGWSVSHTSQTTGYRWALMGLGVAAAFCLAGWRKTGRQGDGGTRGQGDRGTRGQGDGGTRGQGDGGPRGDGWLVFGFLFVALLFYFSPWLPLTLAAGLALAGLLLWRLDLGLALVAAAIPFYLHPRALFGKSFSMVELLVLLSLLSWGLRQFPKPPNLQTPQFPNSLDLAALLFVLASLASCFVAEFRHVALRELRVIVLEPALFYLMLRTARLDRRAVWRIVDFFVLAAVIVALIGLVQYVLGVNVITAEEGFRRLRSVYGSPNNAGLYLGRVLPLALAVALFGACRGRRFAYGLAAVPLGLATLLSFSRGALLLGVPVSMLVLDLLAGGRWLWASLGTVVAAGVAAIPLLRTPRFTSLFDTQSGTLFFRLHLWRSSWTMFREHPWLGVGLDNFLYHYRSRYILPASWQEPNLSHAHNFLLDYATRMGIAGLATGLWLQVAFWRLALPLRRIGDAGRRALALGLMGSMADFLAHGLVDASYFFVDLAFVFFLTLGLMQWLARSENYEI